MDDCSFEKLLQLLNKSLGVSAQLRLYDHLDRCDICRDTLYHIARDRDEVVHVLLPSKKRSAAQRPGSMDAVFSEARTSSSARRNLSDSPATGTMG